MDVASYYVINRFIDLTESSKEASNMVNAACAAASRPGADGQDSRADEVDNVSSRRKYLGQGSAKTRPLRSGRPPDIRGSKTCVLLWRTRLPLEDFEHCISNINFKEIYARAMF